MDRTIKSILGIEIKKIIHQDLFEREHKDIQANDTYTSYYYDVEFLDKRDKYHHYKSCFDKGVVKFTDGTSIDFNKLDPRCIEG